jgi:peptidoglycan/xylan/chitin deacetylase (PgdA/CDA1 family)
VLVALAYWGTMRPDLLLWPGKQTHGHTTAAVAALTFDDGPHPLWTPLLADTLERHGARGTFFLVGAEAMRYPELVVRLARAGHQVASHSYSHPYPNLTRRSRAEINAEIQQSLKVLRQLTDQPVYDFRPPGGALDQTMIDALRAHDLRVAMWSYNTADWSSPAPGVTAARMQAHLRPGVVMLLHQRENTVPALEDFFMQGGKTGYTFLTLNALWQTGLHAPGRGQVDGEP